MNYKNFQNEVTLFLKQAYKRAMSEAIKRGKETARKKRLLAPSPCKRK